MSAPGATLSAADPSSALGARVLRAYMDDVASRYWGRPATSAEVDQALREAPSDDLVLPAGLFIVATVEGEAAGCGGVRFLADGVAELTRVWVAPAMRRHGLGLLMVTHLEERAIEHRRRVMRLDTRGDLTEARALYARLGYHEVDPFNDEPYAEHWFEKAL
jgi:ribosomal protein S18 acetylase RimI-like enzyme